MFQQNQEPYLLNSIQRDLVRGVFRRPIKYVYDQNDVQNFANPVNIDTFSSLLTSFDTRNRVFDPYRTFLVYRNYVNSNAGDNIALLNRAIKDMRYWGYDFHNYGPQNATPPNAPVYFRNDEKSNPINHLVTGIDNLQLGPFIKQESSVFTLNRAQKSLFKGLQKSSTCIDWSCLADMFNSLEGKLGLNWSCHSVFSAYSEFVQKGHKNTEPSG